MKKILWCLALVCLFATGVGHTDDQVPTPVSAAVVESSKSPADAEDSSVEEEAIVEPTQIPGIPWTAPDYSSSANTLGYSKSDFDIPDSLKDRVNFWIDIYAKYDSHKGLLHDSYHIDKIYEVVDFSGIEKDVSLTDRQKSRARRELVKKRKQEIAERLNRLHRLKSPEGLEGEDLRVWKLFEGVEEKDKFHWAAQKGRLRFQLGQANFFKKGIYYSGRYIQIMERIFLEEGLPTELTRLPFVESSFNIYARSKVGASGVWQFMRSTGRLYMKVNGQIDERNDPITAARAAARLLKFNYNLLKAWPLAITAYNYGPAGMAKIAKTLGTTDMAQIIREADARRFGFASENFYACFLAALHVEREAGKFFPGATRAPQIQYEEVRLVKAVPYGQLLRAFKNDKELADLFNPHITRRLRANHRLLPNGILIRLPPDSVQEFLAAKANLKEIPVTEEVEGKLQYEVLPGDTLSQIALEFGASAQAIMDMNDIDNPRKIRPGKVLWIPQKAAAKN